MTKAEYRKVYKEYTLPLFFDPDWLDIVSKEQWRLAHTEHSKGQHTFLFYQIKKKVGIEYSLNFQYTPYTGYLSAGWNDQENEVQLKRNIEILQKEISSDYQYFFLLPDFKSPYPFILNEYTVLTRYTYLKDLTLPILDNIDTRLKKTIENNKEEIKTCISDDISTLCEFHNIAYQGKNPFDSSLLQDLWKRFGNKNLFIIESKHADTPVASILIAIDRTHAYYLAGGTSGSKQSAMSHALIRAMQYCAEQGVEYFDFVGSSKASIERFFRKFKPHTQNYFALKKSDSKISKLMDLIIR